MKSFYKIGDFVRLVEENAEGYVTAILNDGMIAVTGEDGFEIPVPAPKVTMVYGSMGAEENKQIENISIPEAQFKNDGIYLALVGDQKQGQLDFYIVNESSYQLMFCMNTKKADQIKGEFCGQIPAYHAQRIYNDNVKLIGNWPIFNFQIIFFSNHLLKVKEPLVCDKKIRPIDLSTSKKEIPILEEKGWLFKLDITNEDIDTNKLKEHFFSHRLNQK